MNCTYMAYVSMTISRVIYIQRHKLEVTNWTTFVVPSPGASETVYGHTWSVRHDGLLFSSSYYYDRPDAP